MDMDLILWRHADAEAGQADLDRKLTAKGRKQAAAMADWLERHLPDTTKILVSPAVRAQQTAQALDRKFTTVRELAPGAGAASILAAAGWPENRHTVLIVGHQPTLGQVASLLLYGSEQDLAIRKASVWWLSKRAREEAYKTTLRVAICPDYL